MRKLNSGYIQLILCSFLLIVYFSDVRFSYPGSFYQGTGQSNDFSGLLTRAQMTFTMPNGFDETPVINNRQMNYDYALKLPSYPFEVRYAVRPLDSLLKQNETNQKNGKPGFDANQLYVGSFLAILMNISGGKTGQVHIFPKESVKKEFNADWGATSLVPLAKEFGQNYKTCVVVAIHKEHIGDAYYFYLFNQKEDTGLMPTAFYSLKFN